MSYTSSTDRRRRPVLLIALDGAEWDIVSALVDRGEMPTLARLIDQGVLGILTGNRLPLCAPLWTTVVTGKGPDAHGIYGPQEPVPARHAMAPVSGRSRRCKALWNILDESGLESLVIGWPASGPCEPIRGLMIVDEVGGGARNPGREGPAVCPPELAERFESLRKATDNAGRDALERLLPGWVEEGPRRDQRLAMLGGILHKLRLRQAQTLEALRVRPHWDLAAVHFPGLDTLGRAFMRFHPPQMDGVSDEAFARYHAVVEAGYRVHDEVLGELLSAAGADATVLLVSEHGFETGDRRPATHARGPRAARLWRRTRGMLVASGPAVARDELLHGATLLDLAPTVLALLGLPIGRDMRGKVLEPLFQGPPRIEHIDSWEGTSAANGKDRKRVVVDVDRCWEELADAWKTSAEDAPGRKHPYALGLGRLRLNLSEFLLSAKQPRRACAVLAELWQWAPQAGWLGLKLLDMQLASAGRDGLSAAAARETLERLRALPAPVGRNPVSPTDLALREARVLAAEGRHEDALTAFGALVECSPAAKPRWLQEMGKLALAIGDLDAAERHFASVLAREPDAAPAQIGLARTAMRRGDWETVLLRANAAIRLRDRYPQAHCLAGLARVELCDWLGAERSLNRAIELAPGLQQAHRALFRLLSRLGRIDEANRHKHLADALRAQQTAADIEPEP